MTKMLIHIRKFLFAFFLQIPFGMIESQSSILSSLLFILKIQYILVLYERY